MLKELKNVRINNIPLSCYEDGIGLFLHDGLYVNKELAKKYDLCNTFSKHIKEVFDFDISYEIEWGFCGWVGFMYYYVKFIILRSLYSWRKEYFF